MTTSFDAARSYTEVSPHRLPFELPAEVTIQEVGPRDGLQLETKVIRTDAKVALVDALSETGVPRVQVTSFVRADAVPQLADGAEVMQCITRKDSVEYSVLVPNLRGAQHGIDAGATCLETMLSTTDAHSVANANRPTRGAFDRLVDVIAIADDTPGVRVVGGMATALGCPFEGRPTYARVASVAEMYVERGVRHLTIADTAGLSDPGHVYDTSRRLIEDFPDVRITLHLHNTRGLGLANVMAGMAAGITEFDSSIGGLGGCPFAPGATGNIATEELVHLLDLLGVRTNVDLGALVELSRHSVRGLVDHPLESSLDRADPSWNLFDPPTSQRLNPSQGENT